jgi:hypothetical protein
MSLQLYFGLGVALAILGRVIHYLVVTRYLKSRGLEVAKGHWLRDWAEWKAYRAARLAEKQPIIWWYVLWAMQLVLLFWVAGWICDGLGTIRIDAYSHFAERAANSSGYTTAFDVTQAGFRQWTFSVVGLFLIAAGLATRTLVRIGIFRPQYPWMMKWFPRLFVGFAIVWTLISFATTFADYRGAVSAMENNRAQVVEGAVAEFKPMAYSGHSMESFVVQGVRFAYSDYIITAGFNTTTSHGGPIREGLPVKIWYSGGEILRLDIKKEP